MWPFHQTVRLGARGEKLAARFLRRRGLKILARNVSTRRGEIDLIALDRGTRRKLGADSIAFVEVKTRRCDDYVSPASAVNAKKQRRMRRVARQYLAEHPDAADCCVRFDVVSIVLREGQKPEISYIPHAF